MSGNLIALLLVKSVELCYKKTFRQTLCYSAGVGRTGTFIALDSLMSQAEKEKHVNVFACVTKMRENRMNMVQTVVRLYI